MEKIARINILPSRERQLRAAALKLGSRLYAETPAAICRRLEKCWTTWRDEK
jgi:hypothetical protein